jgi:hypothetical protein
MNIEIDNNININEYILENSIYFEIDNLTTRI